MVRTNSAGPAGPAGPAGSAGPGGSTMHLASVRLAARPETVSRARAHVRRFCARWAVDPDDPVRVVSELASNAVEHAGDFGDYEVRVFSNGAVLWIEVLDWRICTLPSPIEVLEDDERGRGLLIVAALTQRFRVDVRGGRKAVCAGFELGR